MKSRIQNLCYLFILLPVVSLAQSTSYGNFKIVGTELIYQKVFDQDSITVDQLAEFLKTAPNVSDVEIVGTTIKAKLTDLTVDYKKFQFSQVAVPPIIQTGQYSGRITAEARDNRYRITLDEITMTGNIGYKKITAQESLTNYACINSGTALSREWCKPNTLGLLDKAITDRFTYTAPKITSDW